MSHSQTQKIQAKAAADGKQRIAISASTTQSLENSVGVMLLSHLVFLSYHMHCHKHLVMCMQTHQKEQMGFL